MRGFIITTVLFSLLLVMIFINVHFTEELIENMKNDIALLSTLPCSENEQIIDKLMKNWEKKSIWLSLSVSYDDIEELTDIMDAVNKEYGLMSKANGIVCAVPAENALKI